MYHGGKYKDLLYRPGVDESRYETLPYDPSQPSRYETMPYRPEAEDPRRSEAAAELLGQAFLEQFLQQNPELIELAGSPSFDIGGGAGDARRARRGLSPADVEWLIQAYPADADKIKKMYMPGPSLPPVRGV